MEIRKLKKQIEKENPKIVAVLKKDMAFQIGKDIEILRAIKGITQSKLAKMLKTKQPSIARIESGSHLPSLSFLKRIANVFETELLKPQFSVLEEKRKKDEGIEMFSTSVSFSENIISPYIKENDINTTMTPEVISSSEKRKNIFNK